MDCFRVGIGEDEGKKTSIAFRIVTGVLRKRPLSLAPRSARPPVVEWSTTAQLANFANTGVAVHTATLPAPIQASRYPVTGVSASTC